MQKIQIHVVTGVHHQVPSHRISAHFTKAAADAAALDLVTLIAADVEDAPAAPEEAAAWPDYLASIQRMIAEEAGVALDGSEDEDELAEAAGCHVTIATLETDAPRVIVSIDGGLVEGAVSDIDLDMYVIDYDTDGQPRHELIDIPQSGGDTSEANMRGETVEVDPKWIDDAVAAYEAHDPDAIDEDEVDGDLEEAA